VDEKDYEKKYKKYKSKYLELKGGGEKRLTFANINKKFNELKNNNTKLYFKRYVDFIKDEKLEIISISEKKNKNNNKYLYINYKDVSEKSVNKGKEDSLSVNNWNMFQFTEATYNLNIKKDSENNFVLQDCIGECQGIVT
jgi:hypothetical protein